jgi:hypothetical protein
MDPREDLIAFIGARLDEDEQRAGYVHDGQRDSEPLGGTGRCVCGWPARVDREVEAMRAILAAHPVTTEVIPPGYQAGTGEKFGCETCHDWDGATEGRGYCETLLALAAIWPPPG